MSKQILKKPDSFYKEFSRSPAANKETSHYCPGCGHGVVHKLIAEAVDDFGIQDRTIFISPVGCSVFAYYYFDCGNIQAAHGRAPAVSTGVKRSRPGSIVISYQGDGDLAGIGGNDILHAANRGENITVFFINNAIYGMTGSQMAPTSLIGQKTTTTPYGRSVSNEGYPLRVSELLATLEAPVYIERVAVTDAKNVMNTRRAIRKALQTQIDNKGFSLVEILSPCPTGWGLQPPQAKKWITEVLSTYFKPGVYRDRTAEIKDTVSDKTVREKSEEEILNIFYEKQNGSEKVFSRPEAENNYIDPRIKISGFGGQGILFLGQLLSVSSMISGYHTTWLPSYGPEMRGGTANCHVNISRKPVGSPLVSETDVLIAMNLPSLDKFEKDVREKGLILINSSLINRKAERQDVDVLYIPATELADELGNTKIANIVMLGAYIAKSNILNPEAAFYSLRTFVKKKEFIEVNEKALRKGMDFVRSIPEKNSVLTH